MFVFRIRRRQRSYGSELILSGGSRANISVNVSFLLACDEPTGEDPTVLVALLAQRRPIALCNTTTTVNFTWCMHIIYVIDSY